MTTLVALATATQDKYSAIPAGGVASGPTG